MNARTRSIVIGLGVSACLLVGPTTLAASVSGPIGSTVLSQGDFGFPVRVLQGDLAQLGDFGGVVTGYFGPSTARALRGFQSSDELVPSGVLDAATLQAIKIAMGIGTGSGHSTATGNGGAPAAAGSGGTTTNAGNGGTASGGSGTASSGSGTASGGSGTASGGSGTASGGSSTSGGTFVQATGSPGISGGLQVGGRIDGLTIKRVIHVTATAYGATAQDNYPYGATDAFGRPLKPGDVAVDPSVIPLNTKLYVTGYRTPYLPKGGELAVARDTGGAIKGNRIDMYINSTNESLINSFGIQQVTAYILGN